MASFLLLHGAWHGAWCWEPLAARLAGAGHSVVAPDLPGLAPDASEGAGRFGLGDHINATAAALGRMADGDIILVAHSYAGMLARALEGLRPGKIGHVVCIEALQPEPGEAVLDLVPDRGESFQSHIKETPLGPVLLPPDVARFAIPDARLAEEIAARLLPQPLRTFTEPLPRSVGESSHAICRTYLYASDRIPNPYQRFIDRLRVEPSCRLVAMSGGHELMLTRPAEVAELLLQIAGQASRNPELIIN